MAGAPGEFLLARQYGAATTPAAEAKAQGRSSALQLSGVATAAAQQRKKRLLDAIKSGALKPEQLGPADKKIVQEQGVAGTAPGFKVSSPTMPTGIIGKAFGLAKNLGEDIGVAAVQAFPGIYKTGKEFFQDQYGFIAKGEKPLSRTRKMLGQQVEAKKQYYNKDWKSHIYHHPLEPILDVLTIASGGASGLAKAGATAGKYGAEGSAVANTGHKLSGITSREGRAPFIHPVTGDAIRREWTPRPVAKGGQKVLDVLTRTGENENAIGRRLRTWDANATTRRIDSFNKAAEMERAKYQLKGMENVKKLVNHPDEAVALTLLQKGINTPLKIEAFQRMVRTNSLDNPDQMGEMLRGLNVTEDYIRQHAELPERIKHFILAPTDLMVAAHIEWKTRVQEHGVDPEISTKHLQVERDRLQPYSEHMTPEEMAATPPSARGIQHVYVPSVTASGFSLYEPNRAARLLNENAQPRMRREKKNLAPRGPFKGVRFDQSLMVTPKASSDYASSGETFATGAFRSDARVYLEDTIKRAHQMAEGEWKKSEIERVAAKEAVTGKLMRFKDQPEVDRFFGKGKMVAVHDDMPEIYFRKEVDYMERITHLMDEYIKEKGLDTTAEELMSDTDFMALAERMTKEDASAFLQVHWMSLRRKAVAMPVDEFNYRMAMMKLDEPFNNKFGRGMAKLMNYWRTAVLTLMPRWAVNTAIGSMVMNLIRGSLDPRDHQMAQRLHKAGILPKELATPENVTALPTGARLGHQATQQLIDDASPGYGGARAAQMATDMGIHAPVHMMAQGVQTIENHFRQGQFLHNLRRENKLRQADIRAGRVSADEQTRALGELGGQLHAFYQDILGQYDHGGHIGQALLDPVARDRALRETDKMMYNFQVLGPFERRYVRQFVPFWGWYKFITMAAYRLPIEYPGRMNLISQLSQIAQEQEQEFGPMPSWLRGNIPLGFDKKTGTYSYVSTMGMNPFATVFNPLGPKGAIQGSLALGQTSPAIQGLLSAFGFDTLSGNLVGLSPQEGVGQDYFGALFKNNEEVSPVTQGGVRRLFMGLARSVPEFRLLERYGINPHTKTNVGGYSVNGFGAPFPESIPLIAPRPMAEAKGSANPFTTEGIKTIGANVFGVGPRPFKLADYQGALPNRLSYQKKQNVRQTKKLGKRLHDASR